MHESSIEQQILHELSKITELTTLISKAEENYNISINLLDRVKIDFESERKNRKEEFAKWQVTYSNEMKNLNKGLEDYIRLIPADNSELLTNLSSKVTSAENIIITNRNDIKNLEKKLKRTTVIMAVLIIANLISLGLMFLN
jgi:uncharacterized protein (DUF342 family)